MAHIYPVTKAYRCEQCDKTFCYIDKYKRHLKIHESGDRKYKCSVCAKVLSRKDKLAEHLKNMHAPGNSTKRKLEENSEPPKKTRVPSPTETRSTVRNLNTEKCRLKKEGNGFVDKPFQCERCCLGFRKRGMLAQHFARRHPEIPVESVQNLNVQYEKVISEFPCPYCDKSYKSSTKRKRHIKTNHPDDDVPQSYKTMSATVKSSYIRCPWCRCQYTIKCKLYAHQRAKHQKLLNILDVTGITEDALEKMPISKKNECLQVLGPQEGDCDQNGNHNTHNGGAYPSRRANAITTDA